MREILRRLMKVLLFIIVVPILIPAIILSVISVPFNYIITGRHGMVDFGDMVIEKLNRI